ncbi:hypothetical protein DEO72_LG4g537 [Vigna unguiculata]|uniref:Uncharacterized protein n=1 Tax=Vigna unguiculata TaxID=3917 RepID=A0A4D6LLX5_VIGUN|nr:hypothetical protein DEO72_LG4g537 [Vigna unguiculata]
MATTMSSMVYVFRRISQDVLLSHLQATTCRARKSIWTHPYEPQLAHSHWQHSPTQAATQEFLVFIRYPKPQLKGYVLRHNSRNTSKLTFEISPKPCRQRTSKVSKTQALPLHYRLAMLLSRQAKRTSKSPGGGHVPPSTKRLGAQ